MVGSASSGAAGGSPTPEEYASFVRLYRGREDRLGLKQGGSYQPLAGGLTYERFCEHLGLVATYGLHPMDDEGRVRFGLFDFDVLPREQGWECLLPKLPEEKEKVRKLLSFLKGLGLPESAFLVEFPTVGYHVLLFFEEPVPAGELRRFMRASLAACGLEKTPSYPKAVAPPGDVIQLPFRTNKNTGRRSNLVRELEGFEPSRYDPTPDFAPLERVTLVPGAFLPAALRTLS